MKFKTVLFTLVLLLGVGGVKAETYEETSPPAGLSKKELLKWEVEHIPAEFLDTHSEGDVIFLNNHYCPLQHREIQAPREFISREFSYKGKNPKFKGKKFVFNFCCGVCRQRFVDHFDKYPDEILKRYGIE